MAEEGGGSARRPTPEQQDQREEEESTFKFPIQEPGENHDEEIKMKNIPPSVLPNFYGMASEDPDSFLFEFDIVCRTYGYTDDAHRLRLFPTTLKASALRWFMGLGEHAITCWDGMRRIFLKKYQPYCRSKDSKDDIFRMNQQEDENLEMGKGDISTLPFEEIAELCEKYSRSKARNGKRAISSKATKSASTSVTRAEIGNLLEEFKTDLLSTLGTQIDTLKAKKRQEEEDQLMAIFCPKCRKKHALKECPLENIQVCAFCTENHDIFHCSKVKILQNCNVVANTNLENVYFMGAKRPWQPRPPPLAGMFPNQNLQFPAQDQMYAQNSWNVPMPWQHQNYPQQQWRPAQQYSQQYQPYPQPYQPYSQPYQQYHQPYSQCPPTYQQYPQQQVVYQPQNTQQALPAPPPINPPQLQLPSNQQPTRPTQIPAQPVPNPNNQAERPAYSIDEGPSYPTLPLQNINLRSGKVLQKEPPIAEKQEENEENENETPTQRKQNDDIKNKQMQPLHPPPFPDRLVQAKLPMFIPQFDVLDELKNVYIKIPLQAIKDIPIYTKEIKELCLKKPTRKRVDPQTIHVIGHLAGLMTNTISMEKYVDPSIPRVTTIINNIHIPNTLIDLGAAINVMTLDTMKTLQLTNLQRTTIVLELADRSKVIPEGILEDIIVSLDSWEYPVDFLVLQPKSNLGGHPIILGRPWLATADAFIGCRSGNMIISRGTERKQLTLYPSAQSATVAHNLWLDDK
eukprot:PITA_16362